MCEEVVKRAFSKSLRAVSKNAGRKLLQQQQQQQQRAGSARSSTAKAVSINFYMYMCMWRTLVDLGVKEKKEADRKPDAMNFLWQLATR